MKRVIAIVLAVAAVGTLLVIRYYPFSNIIPIGPRQTAADAPGEVADEQLTAAQAADEPEPQETIATTEPEPRETAAATAPDESHRNVAAPGATETETDKLARSPRGSTAVVGLPGATFQLGAGDRLGEVIFNRYAAMVRAKAGKARYAAEQP